MEDKTFELIEKLYNRMEDGFMSVNTRIDSIEANMATKADLARMEYEHAQKFGALFDGLTANTEAIVELKTETGANTTAIHELKTEVQSLKTEVKNHEIKLKLVK